MLTSRCIASLHFHHIHLLPSRIDTCLFVSFAEAAHDVHSILSFIGFIVNHTSSVTLLPLTLVFFIRM
jgi:hypothetical protein